MLKSTLLNLKWVRTEIQTGMPQGSILGPLLFIIYINDIKTSTELFNVITYADDTTLMSTLGSFNSNQQQNSVEQNINEELNKISGWLKVNKLSLNAKKSKFMIFKQVNKKIEPLSLKIENTNIERVTDFNFLGLTISDNLEWKNHVQKIGNNCSRTIGILNKLKHILPANISLMLYNSLLLPQLNYCILAWGHNCKRLIKLQKKALRAISISKYNAHTDPLFKKYRILKLHHLLQLQELKCYHKYINKKLPVYLQNIPLKQNKSFHAHLTRSHLKLHITRTNHRFAERCIRNSIPLLVNTTPMELINKIPTHSLHNVGSRTKEYYLSAYQEHCAILNCYVCQMEWRLGCEIEQKLIT